MRSPFECYYIQKRIQTAVIVDSKYYLVLRVQFTGKLTQFFNIWKLLKKHMRHSANGQKQSLTA